MPGPTILDNFLAYSEDIPTPALYRKWAGISLISSALERRVWFRSMNQITIPNLFVMLVGPPATGKGIINHIRSLLSSAFDPTGQRAFCVASDSVTKASFMDELGATKNRALPGQHFSFEYHALALIVEEITAFMPGYSYEIVGALNSLYNNVESYTETRRASKVKSLTIPNPTINLLFGVQPNWLANSMPPEVWDSGIISRIIMVWAGESPIIDPFKDEWSSAEHKQRVQADLAGLSVLQGEFKLTEPAREYLRDWYMSKGLAPVPTHSRLKTYCGRRLLHTLKLSCIAAVSRRSQGSIDLEDVLQAQAWLFEAESVMPDIFRAMLGKSDLNILQELHYFVTELWSLRQRSARPRPISSEEIMHFLSDRAPSDKVVRIFDLAQRARWIDRVAGEDNMWVPVARTTGYGVE